MKREKTGGRKAGTPNKTTSDLRAAVTAFVEANWQTVQAEFDSLDAKDKLQFIDKMLAYSLPKLQATQIDLTTQFERMSDEDLDALFKKVITAADNANS